VTSCPSGTTANSANTNCDVNSGVSTAAQDQNGCDGSSICYTRIYYSWMTIVVGVVDGVMIVAICINIASSMLGMPGYFVSAQQSAAKSFGGANEAYLDRSANKTNVNLNDTHDEKEDNSFYKAPK
jgi:hypothetical protein